MGKVRLNDDQEVVALIREGLKRTGGYCPCRLARTPENKCMCEEFREQIADPNFEGYCHTRVGRYKINPLTSGCETIVVRLYFSFSSY